MTQEQRVKFFDYIGQHLPWFLGIVFLGMAFFFNMNAHIKNLDIHLKATEKAKIVNHLEEVEKNEGEYVRKSELNELKEQLKSINGKLDKLLMSKWE